MKNFILLFAILCNAALSAYGQLVTLSDVVPDAILEIRYFSTYNFVGARIDGYVCCDSWVRKESDMTERLN